MKFNASVSKDKKDANANTMLSQKAANTFRLNLVVYIFCAFLWSRSVFTRVKIRCLGFHFMVVNCAHTQTHSHIQNTDINNAHTQQKTHTHTHTLYILINCFSTRNHQNYQGIGGRVILLSPSCYHSNHYSHITYVLHR